jgi:glycosyltransferase involved in cell wall biosynthesis
MMRVLYFTRDYTPHDHRFLAALAATPHQVFSLRLERRDPQREDRPLPAGIEQIPWEGGLRPARWQGGLRLVAGLKRVLRQVEPDVVHAGSIQTAAFLTALAGFKPLVTMSWGSDLLQDANRSAPWRWATRFTLQRSAILVGDCQAVKDKAVGLGFPADRVVLFPWGVDLQHFNPAAPTGAQPDLRRRAGWEAAFVLLSLRSWEPLYGVDVVVRAFIDASKSRPDLRLILLGTGSQAPAIHQMLEHAGLHDLVMFGGQVRQADLPRYYRAADLYLSASHSDGSSVSLMEALACSKPVVVSDIPGNREWVSPETGWIFADGDAHALARCILAAASESVGLAQKGAAGRLLAEQRADWSQNFQRLLLAYQMALESQRRRAD